jgi:hypothetical protein
MQDEEEDTAGPGEGAAAGGGRGDDSASPAISKALGGRLPALLSHACRHGWRTLSDGRRLALVHPWTGATVWLGVESRP